MVSNGRTRRGSSSGILAIALCLSVCMRVCVCPSPVGVLSKRLNDSSWFFFHLSYTVFKGNSNVSKNKGTSVWNFVPNSGFRKFRFDTSIVKACHRLAIRYFSSLLPLLSSTEVDAQLRRC